MKRIIYHLPFKIDSECSSASQIRPVKMLEAFQKKGYEVTLITGSSFERKKQMQCIKKKILNGEKYDFLYSESSTEPTLLTDSHHFPLHPFIDFSLWRFCKNNNIPIGLFYRDIYWNFSNLQNWVSYIVRPFYIYDIMMYKKLLSVLFLPSKEMLKYIPEDFSNITIRELPSGADIHECRVKKYADNIVRILYIGGIDNDCYSLLKMVKAVSKYPEQIEFTICCREKEWLVIEKEYEIYCRKNIKVVHKKGADISLLYDEADIFCMAFNPDLYRTFAVPYKLFEAIGYGCPIIATKGTWVGNFVLRNKIGYTVNYDDKELCCLLDKLILNKGKLFTISSNVLKIQQQHTWEHRVEEIVSCFKS